MCGTTEILLKNVRDNWNPIEKCAGQLKSYRKLRKKPHNLSPIPWTAGNPGKSLTILRSCLVVVGWLLLVGSDNLCRGPLRGQWSPKTATPILHSCRSASLQHFLTFCNGMIPFLFCNSALRKKNTIPTPRLLLLLVVVSRREIGKPALPAKRYCRIASPTNADCHPLLIRFNCCRIFRKIE